MKKKLGLVGNYIKDKDDKYKAKYKAEKLSKCKTRDFDGIVIEELGMRGNDLMVVIKGQGSNNPFYFINPPILIKDGTKSEVENNGKMMMVDNYKEDLEGSLKEMIKEVLRTIKNNKWQ